jgi:hypothetical protein
MYKLSHHQAFLVLHDTSGYHKEKYKFAVLPHIEGTLQNRLSNMDEIVEKKVQFFFFPSPSRKKKF